MRKGAEMAEADEPTTRDLLDAILLLATAVSELGRSTQAGFEGLGRSVAGVDACVAKLDTIVGQVRDAVAPPGDETGSRSASASPAPEPAGTDPGPADPGGEPVPAVAAAARRPRRPQRGDVG